MGVEDNHLFEYFDELESHQGNGFVSFTSSGSTGEPKQLRQSWEKFKSGLGTSNSTKGLVWGTCFAPDSYAGIQVAAQVWKSCGKVLFLDSQKLTDLSQHLIDSDISALSVTPTWLRLYAISGHVVPKLKFITLGGEPVNQQDIRLVHRLFPNAKHCVIYAAGELGIIFKSKNYDGEFIRSDLDPQWTGYSIQDNELILNSQSNKIRTGDFAEYVDEDKIRIIGRKGRIANVGGYKISLSKIEELINEMKGVDIVQCHALPNPISGQIIQCNWLGNATEDEIREYCINKLSKNEIPRLYVHGEIKMGPNGKKQI